jgi:hypothetical protein
MRVHQPAGDAVGRQEDAHASGESGCISLAGRDIMVAASKEKYQEVSIDVAKDAAQDADAR